MKDNKERLHWVDWAKTIGIILVVWAHISPIGMKEIFIFHMPLFFMISGILYKQRGFLPELKSSTCGLLIPYLLYNLLYMSPLPLGGERNIRTIVNVLLGNQEQLCYVMVPLWFLVSLFFMRLICSIKVIRIEVIGAASFVLSLLLFGYLKIDQTNDYFQLKTTCFCLPFFCIGYSLMKHVPIQRCKRKIIIGGHQ